MVRLYRALLVAYPPAFRARFGAELALAFSEGLIAARRSGRRHALAFIWSRCADAIISESRLPGFTGLEVLARLKAQERGVPFILIASTPDEDVYREADRLGADFVLEKPLDLEDVLEAIYSVGEEHPPL